jgi:DhnA family fructose-bisphosphate aldolase class Ia
MSAGKEIRLNHIFARDGKTVIAALDHGIAGIAPLDGLGRPDSLIPAITAAGVDAIIVSPGLAGGFAGLFSKAGLIVRVDCGPTAQRGEWCESRPALAAEDALRMGADAVIAMGIVGTRDEAASLRSLAVLAGECDRWGIALVAEMLPGGFAAKEVTPAQIASAARVGADLGADFIKVAYSGSVESFREVVSSCYRPVVVLGGSKQPPEALVSTARDAVKAGARGMAVGRNIWQSGDPGRITASLVEAIHG